MKLFLIGSVIFSLFVSEFSQAESLKLCALEEDQPRSSRQTETGVDIEFAKSIAKDLGQPLSIVWVPSRKKIVELEDSDLPLGRLIRGNCDLIGSVPGSEALGPFRSRINLSRPYYGMAFELVGPPKTPQSLKELRSTTIAVQLQTFSHLILQKLEIPLVTALTTKDAFRMIGMEKAEAALVWGPDLGPLGLKPLGGFKSPQALRWNAHFAMRKNDSRIKQISDYLGKKLHSGSAREILNRYGVPLHRPFETVSNVLSRTTIDF